MKIVGRKNEISQLTEAYNSGRPEFIAVYGRRRVGKTYLIRNLFEKEFTFAFTGGLKLSTKEQIKNFHEELKVFGSKEKAIPRTWGDAFRQLRKLIESSKAKRKVVFIDELPWLDAPRSGFVGAFEYFWNSWGSGRSDLMLIVCGSATSWIINKILSNRGGLHNRVTGKINLRPFTLAECETYCSFLKLPVTRNDILEGYMVMGGVPLYWSKLKKEKSMAQNINDLFLKEGGEFRNEYNALYSSVFSRPEKHLKVIEALATRKSGLRRDEITKAAGLGTGGNLTIILNELTECGFIRKYCHTGKKLRDAVYQLVDSYTLFYFQFCSKAAGADDDYWLKIQMTPRYRTWCGLAFERVCLLHIRQIKAALGIGGMLTSVHSWYSRPTSDNPGVQIDLLIDRADNVVSVCEMKYAPLGYKMTKGEADKIRRRLSVFASSPGLRKGVQLVLVTSNGLSGACPVTVHRHLTSDDLFA